MPSPFITFLILCTACEHAVGVLLRCHSGLDSVNPWMVFGSDWLSVTFSLLRIGGFDVTGFCLGLIWEMVTALFLQLLMYLHLIYSFHVQLWLLPGLRLRSISLKSGLALVLQLCLWLSLGLQLWFITALAYTWFTALAWGTYDSDAFGIVKTLLSTTPLPPPALHTAVGFSSLGYGLPVIDILLSCDIVFHSRVYP